MFPVISRLTLVVLAGLAGLCLFIVSQPVADDGLAELLLPPSGCPAPCFLGLRPGVTTVDEAVRILRSHPWVSEITAAPVGSGTLRWIWNGQQPPILGHGARYGDIDIRDGQVTAIHILTPISFGTFWLVLGRPDRGTIGRSRVMPQSLQTHRAIYSDYGLELKTVISQNHDIQGFWNAAVEIIVMVDTATTYAYSLPCWVGCVK